MELEINLPEDFTESTETIELTKPRKKKVYTAPKTNKQLENFDKAKQIRLERINKKKQEDQEKLIKQILDNEKKIKNSQKLETLETIPKETKIKKTKVPVYEDPSSGSDSDSDEEIIIKSKPKSKPKPKPKKKKTVVYLSESESESEEEIPVQKTRIQRKPVQSIQQPIRQEIVKPTEYKNYFI